MILQNMDLINPFVGCMQTMKMILQDMDLINPFVGCIQTMTTKWTQDQTMTAISQDKANRIEVQLDIISPTTLPSPSNVRQGDGFGFGWGLGFRVRVRVRVRV